MRTAGLILSIIIFSSCASIYIPSAPNIALISEKKELDVNAGIFTNSLILSGAYGLSDKYSLIGGTSLSYGAFTKYDNLFSILVNDEEIVFNDENINYKHCNSELGFGKYKVANENRIIELYTGLGYGYTETTISQKANYGSLFLQANYGIKKAHAEFGLSAKLIGSYFAYSESHFSGYNTNEQFPVLTAQIGGITRFGFEKFKFWVSPGVNISSVFVDSYNNELGFVNEDFTPLFHLGFGINYNFKVK